MENDSSVVVTQDEKGEYFTAVITMGTVNGQPEVPPLVGSGTSRKARKAVSYALEDIAAKIRVGA